MLSVRCNSLLTVLFVFLSPVHPQEPNNQMLFKGNIYDEDSLEHLPYVTISVNGKDKYVSNEKGYFEVKLLQSDTIAFKCTGYETVTLFPEGDRMKEDTIFLEVLMKAKIYDIPEAQILPWRNYDEFRSALVSHESDPITDIARKNVDIIMLQNKQNIGPAMDAYSNYRYLMKMKDENNNRFIILSSEPGKGLYFLITRLINP